jgi:hypothetical protein
MISSAVRLIPEFELFISTFDIGAGCIARNAGSSPEMRDIFQLSSDRLLKISHSHS